jgi:uncharacterized protein (TIGR03435 family)
LQVRIIASIAIMMLSAVAQTPEFEVASIKPSPASSGPIRVGSRGGPGTNDPGLFICENCGAAMLLRRAFDLQDYQLSDQVWMQSTRFNVAARIPEGATREQFLLMLRNLLTERLKLKFHYEKKETQAYELVVMKNGPKMKESSAVPDREDTPARPPTEFKRDADGFPILPLGRELALVTTADGRAAMSESETTMEQLARILTAQVNQPVTDATGLHGKYDFTLHWVGEGAALVDAGPNIFRALQEQLGLKLESKKGMVDVLIVDHLEKTPTEN